MEFQYWLHAIILTLIKWLKYLRRSYKHYKERIMIQRKSEQERKIGGNFLRELENSMEIWESKEYVIWRPVQ